MNLFSLPAELQHLIFDEIVLSREIPRVMRIRLVNREFKNHIDAAFFRMRLFERLVDDALLAQKLGRHQAKLQQRQLTYLHTYLTYEVMRATSASSTLGRVRRAAQALCGHDGDAGSEAIMSHVIALVRLLMGVLDLRAILAESTVQPQEIDLQADITVAAVYLGYKSYVKGLIAEGAQFCCSTESRGVKSSIFGNAFEAAAMQGNLDIIKLLLSTVTEFRDTGILPSSYQHDILRAVSVYGYRDMFEFAMEAREKQIDPPTSEAEPLGYTDDLVLESVLKGRVLPDHYEKVAQLLGPSHHRFNHRLHGAPSSWLNISVYHGNEGMVRYFLEQGASPNNADAPLRHQRYKPLLRAVRQSNDRILKILLDAGADPNWGTSALMEAAWKRNVTVARLLINHGGDVNLGSPPPIVVAIYKEDLEMFRLLREHGARLDTPETGGWTMAVARAQGFSSMVDLLISQLLSPAEYATPELDCGPGMPAE
ncbi:ankyrin repeat-containing domain protein [Xylariales sp. PMI_506]|nr:ankyrin repeat-containing domain protein [Xylariales sp. PMI_506]